VPTASEGIKSARSRPPAGLFDETTVAAKETTRKIVFYCTISREMESNEGIF
jgi:hypothetical protein